MDVELTNLRVVTVDGGTATGKSRLVEELASLLRLKGIPVIHVSSGHLYRAAAFLALEYVRAEWPDATNEEIAASVRTMDAQACLDLMRTHLVEMHNGAVWIDGSVASVEGKLKAPLVGVVVPHVASFLPVRQLVNSIIRRQINEFDGYVLIDGRDIGHGVVPDARLKLLLVVSPEIAAVRSIEHTKDEIIARDEADRRHKHGPLPHPDNVHESVRVISTDSHTPESVRDEVYALMREVFTGLPEL